MSNYRLDDFIRDAQHMLASAGLTNPRQREEIARGIGRVDERSRQFFSGLAMARTQSSGAEARARYTPESIADHLEAGLMLTGALEGLEAVLALTQQAAGAAGPRRRTRTSRRSSGAPGNWRTT